ncbi:NADH-ubiquinone oxidoreductase-F iron-sulfur binding region domain-containing protein [Chloroflexota bacterium]
MSKLNTPAELEELRKSLLSKQDGGKPCIAVCGGTGCHNQDNGDIIAAFKKETGKAALKGKVDVKEIGCPGLCSEGPVVVVHPEGICYVRVKPEDVEEIVSQTVAGKVVDRLLYTDPDSGEKAVHEQDIPFYKNQVRLLTANNSKIDPRNIEDYIAAGGYSALTKVINGISPEQVIEEIKESGLRGRSGGGFPAGRKWEAGRKAEGDIKYIICNCHEGDPGAFVDRRLMEGNPHSIIEGMIIGAYAIGSTEGFIFVGDEFPLTVHNTETAIKQAEEYGLLGENILGSGLNLTIRINIDGGDYVCGESTSLMASMEGKIGEPRTKYDHATERGLWARPTVLNNLQTWACVPYIINQGAAGFNSIGTENSKGTRVFSIVGKVKNVGLVEVPMGMTLREIIFNIGGGIRGNKKFKAVQVGGPLGGFVPESKLDMPVDFNEMSDAGFSPGPSLIVLDEDSCVFYMIKYYLEFLYDESCGKCTPCRDGIRQMLRIVTRITEGKGKEGDFELLELLSEVQADAALCALGQGASGPFISGISHFREGFEFHIKEGRCPVGLCDALAGKQE